MRWLTLIALLALVACRPVCVTLCTEPAGVPTPEDVGDAGTVGDTGPDTEPEADTADAGDTMATIQFAPTAIYDKSNYTTATVGDINDDPYNPDGTFVSPDAAGDGQIGVDFPTPPGSLAATQTFAVWVRGTPQGLSSSSIILEVYEGPTKRDESIATLVTNAAGQLIEFVWNGALISDPSQVRCLIRMVEGNTGIQADIGAVAWKSEAGLAITGADWDLTAPGADYSLIMP
jgi:hypothetical protein